MRRHTLALLATLALSLTACSSTDTDTPTEQPPPANPATTPASPTGDTVPTLDRWVNVPCSPEGAKAKSSSGGALECKKVGSDKQPEWHAVNP